MARLKPDLDWYTRLSHDKGVPPRCPFANVHRCPRYYSSLWLIGRKGGATQIAPEVDEALLRKWQKSDLWPVTLEQGPGAFGTGDRISFSNMCPETTYDRFGWFTSGLYPYADEVDQEAAHARLGRFGDDGEEWRWSWWMLHPMHYTECPLYSQLLHRANEVSSTPLDAVGKERILDARPNFWGISLNLNALVARVVTRVARWWRSRKENSQAA